MESESESELSQNRLLPELHITVFIDHIADYFVVVFSKQTRSRLSCAAECNKIQRKSFSFNKKGNVITGECHLQLKQCVELNGENGTEYYVKP